MGGMGGMGGMSGMGMGGMSGMGGMGMGGMGVPGMSYQRNWPGSKFGPGGTPSYHPRDLPSASAAPYMPRDLPSASAPPYVPRDLPSASAPPYVPRDLPSSAAQYAASPYAQPYGVPAYGVPPQHHPHHRDREGDRDRDRDRGMPGRGDRGSGYSPRPSYYPGVDDKKSSGAPPYNPYQHGGYPADQSSNSGQRLSALAVASGAVAPVTSHHSQSAPATYPYGYGADFESSESQNPQESHAPSVSAGQPYRGVYVDPTADD